MYTCIYNVHALYWDLFVAVLFITVYISFVVHQPECPYIRGVCHEIPRKRAGKFSPQSDNIKGIKVQHVVKN